MPADGVIRGVNIPIAQWCTGDPELTVALYELTYPYGLDSNSNPIRYPLITLDSTGWIGGYDMVPGSGEMVFDGNIYTLPGTPPECSIGTQPVANYAADPLGQVDSPFGPQGIPQQGLIWPDGLMSPTLDPINNPASNSIILDNWLTTSDYGTDPVATAGTWVGILVYFSGTGTGADSPAFWYADADQLGLNDPWVGLKFYSGCGGTSGSGGWHIRHWVFNFQLAVLLTGQNYDVWYEYIAHLPTTLSTTDRYLSAEIYDNTLHGPGLDSVKCFYQVDTISGDWHEIPMILQNGGVYGGVWDCWIPGQEPGTIVSWYIETYITDHPFPSTVFSYEIYDPIESNLFLLNTANYPIVNHDNYLDGSELQTDFWDANDNGLGSVELFNFYDLIIEITGSLPAHIHSDSLITTGFFEQINSGYILTGDEWLGYQSGYTDLTYTSGSFQYDILGIAADYNDINYLESGAHRKISRILPVEDDPISGPLFDYLGDSLDLNYDPYNELGFYNWLDAVEPTAGTNVCFYGVPGTLDSVGNPTGNDTLPVGIYRELDNGTRVVFFAFDPLATNTTPSYHWIGVEPFGPLQAAVSWVLGTAATGEEPLIIPRRITLHQNYPNPFNPVTTIQYGLPRRLDVQITIYDLLGRMVTTLVSETQDAGFKSVEWDATDVSSGMYFYQIRAGEYAQTRKLVVLK